MIQEQGCIKNCKDLKECMENDEFVSDNDVEWEFTNRGHSQHEFNSLEELMAEYANGAGLIEDFGDPNEFDEEFTIDSGWKIVSIEEVK